MCRLLAAAALIVWISTTTVAQAADPAPAAKPASKMTYGPGVETLRHTFQGPFVTMPDGAILGIEENTVIRSTDGGATWTKSEIFSEKQKADLNLKISNERALLLTRDGSLVLGCMNLNSRNWTWDKTKHDAPGAVLATWAMRSTDGGKTWTDVQKLHDDWTGAVRDVIQTKSGRIVMTSMKLLNDPGRHSVIAYASDDDGKT